MAISISALLGKALAFISNVPNQLLPPQTISRRTQFTQILDQWWSTPSMNFLWMVIFDLPNLLTDSNMEGWNEDIGFGPWGVDAGASVLHRPYMSPSNISGCMFAQEVTLPRERSNVEYAGIYNRGFTYSPVMKYRNAPEPLRIKLLETNTSFTDSIIRPWLILASHYGPVARPDGSTIKTNMVVYELAKSGDYTTDVIIRKQWFFTDCFPVNIDPFNKQYAPDPAIITRDTEFAFTRYQIVNNFPDGQQIIQRVQ